MLNVTAYRLMTVSDRYYEIPGNITITTYPLKVQREACFLKQRLYLSLYVRMHVYTFLCKAYISPYKT
jgi:hypothetical protein